MDNPFDHTDVKICDECKSSMPALGIAVLGICRHCNGDTSAMWKL